MNCALCGQGVAGEIFVREGELFDGTPLISLQSTSDRNWICCDACNILLCNKCCQYPESGYCDACIEKYQLLDYLISVGLVGRRVPP